jgi:hypothetical protein
MPAAWQKTGLTAASQPKKHATAVVIVIVNPTVVFIKTKSIFATRMTVA